MSVMEEIEELFLFYFLFSPYILTVLQKKVLVLHNGLAYPLHRAAIV